MSDARNAGAGLGRAARLLDPRWQWLGEAWAQLYRELEPGMRLCSASMLAQDLDGTMVVYTRLMGNPEIHRAVVTDPQVLAQAAIEGTVNATPDRP